MPSWFFRQQINKFKQSQWLRSVSPKLKFRRITITIFNLICLIDLETTSNNSIFSCLGVYWVMDLRVFTFCFSEIARVGHWRGFKSLHRSFNTPLALQAILHTAARKLSRDIILIPRLSWPRTYATPTAEAVKRFESKRGSEKSDKHNSVLLCTSFVCWSWIVSVSVRCLFRQYWNIKQSFFSTILRRRGMQAVNIKSLTQFFSCMINLQNDDSALC